MLLILGAAPCTRHREGPEDPCQDHGMPLTPGTGRKALSGHSKTQNHPKETQCCTCWGLDWDAGWAGVQLDGFLSPQRSQNPMKFSTMCKVVFPQGMTPGLRALPVPPAQMDSLLLPAACGRSCYSKVLLGVIRIKRSLALQRTQPCAATDGPGAFLVREAQSWSNSIFSNYKYNPFCLFLL